MGVWFVWLRKSPKNWRVCKFLTGCADVFDMLLDEMKTLMTGTLEIWKLESVARHSAPNSLAHGVSNS